MSPTKFGKKLLTKLTTHLNIGCGCGSSTKPNIPNVYEPKLKVNKPRSSTFSSPRDGDGEITCTSTSPSATSSSAPSHQPNCNEMVEKTNIVSASVSASASRRWKSNASIGSGSSTTTVVEMESENPCDDFQQSMLEMIKENQIFSSEQLLQLLNCFLRLNSPAHHHLILCAFFQVCQYAVVSSSNQSPHAPNHPL
ncbi:hypothetical protein BVRB_7g170890 [Beta vulgaris subsp. vulgaris]|nr:hypothetical protein BVRB_7g170890 [Beta vulgaris subsp. vulgaris]